MARTKVTARKSKPGRVPRRQLNHSGENKEEVPPDHDNNFDTLQQDVLGEDGSDSDDDFDYYKKEKKFGEDEDNEEKKIPFMFFDFRHGKDKFPENVTLVDAKRAADLLEKATAEAEENAKANKKNNDDAEDLTGDKKAEGPVGPSADSRSTSMWSSYDSKKSSAGEKENIEDNGANDAVFEVLRDGSTALVMKAGYRLKLDLAELLEGGDEEKERRKKKAEREKKRRAKMSSSYSMWGSDAWDYKTSGYKWYKEYVNSYTITIDMKLLEEPPRDGLSLFQTALIHAEDDKRSGKTTFTRSDGECIINQAGGVGMFGTYGDTTRAKVETNCWKRVVVTVNCGSSSSEKGEMRTWVGTESGVVLKEESITANERFAIDPTGGLYMFSSSQSSMMPGQVAVRAIRVESTFSTDEDVKANRAKDKVLSRFEDERKAEAEEQRKGLSLAALFPKPRPMWITPTVWGLFGDSFLEHTALEGSSSLAWSYTVLNFALQRMIKQKIITGSSSSELDGHIESKDDKRDDAVVVGLSKSARVGLSDTLHVLQQSAVVFKNMLRMLKTPTESQLLSFLKKLKKILGNISKGESLLLPLLIENSELLILLERSTERVFKVVVIQTDPFGGLKNHAVSANHPNSEIKFRTCLVLNNVVKKHVLDDVFWVSVYNLAINRHKGDIDRFYDVLIPFLTGKPLEESLVEAENEALSVDNSSQHMLDLYGEFRSPQRSDTAYVRCVIEAMHYMLRRRGLSEYEVNTVHLALCVEVMEMIKNDLVYILPEENGQRVCALAVRELSHSAVKLSDQAYDEGVDKSSQITFILKKVHELADDVTASLQFCQDETFSVPPLLELTDAKTDEDNDPAKVQFANMLAWDVATTEPDPGQAVSLRKYVPVDFLQIPEKVRSRDDAVTAIRQADRLCTLIENQSHCIKNDKFLIASLIEHVFVQVLPVPKPRSINLSEKEKHISERSVRREEKQNAEALAKAEEKKKKMKKLRDIHGNIEKDRKTLAREKKEAERKALEEEEKAEAEKMAKVECIGEELTPDFSVGKEAESEVLNLNCIWDGPITYDLQVELLICLQRLCEHFVAAAMSIQQSRPFDAVCIVVPGCICAISDAIIRKIATDEPSEACSHLIGRTAGGRQLGCAGFGLSVGSFASQSETIELHYAELSVARTAVIDYFQSPQQKRLQKIFSWEEDFILKPGRHLIRYLRMISREIALPIGKPFQQLCDGLPEQSHLMKNYPELKCYRDVAFWWKYVLNPDRKIFPNYSNPEEPKDVPRLDRMTAQLVFRFDESVGGYCVSAIGNELRCRPDPNQTDPVTGTVIDPSNLPTHRFPSTASPSFYVPAPPIRSEDDVIYRPNLPSFDNSYGQVLNQRDSELLISYLTVPYMRLPLLITFFSTEDRIHKLQSPELRNILDSVLFEPGKYLAIDMGGVEPLMVPTVHKDLLASPYGLLLNELYRSPESTIRAVLSLLKSALAVDTGSVVDEGAEVFNTSTIIILYITRLAARFDNYLSFLIDWTKGRHSSVETPLRDVEVVNSTLQVLEQGRQDIRALLHNQFISLFEDYLQRLDSQIVKDPNNEFLIDRNSRLACDLHSHKLLLYRNFRTEDMNIAAAKTLVGSFVYLTTRHTWNKAIRRKESANGKGIIEEANIQMPETELYELLQNQRRRLVVWGNSCSQGVLDEIMQTALQVSSSLTGSFKTSAAVLDKQNRWSRIQGIRSYGRWAVGSTRTTAVAEVHEDDNEDDDLPPLMSMTRHASYNAEVGEVADTGMLGVEIDCQLGQMTLRSKHLSALVSDIANHPDVIGVFGDSTIQASLIERAENRQIYRLVGLNHQLEYWPTPHTVCPPLGDEWDREYDPAELFDSEQWIINLFEPVRKNFFDGPSPPPMQFMLPEKALPEDAEVAVVVGLHQKLGGPWKLVYLFRRLRCLHIYECVSQGREWWFSLHLTTDTRYCLRDMQPSYQNRQSQYPDWWVNASGSPYPMGCDSLLVNDIDNQSSNSAASVLVVRDQQHPSNLSGGKEVLVPSRFLYGVLPDALLDNYDFWQDESVCSSAFLDLFEASEGKGNICAPALPGYKYLRGYPKDDGEYMMLVEFRQVGSVSDYLAASNEKTSNMTSNETKIINNEYVVQCTGLPGRVVSVTRRPKKLVQEDFKFRQKIASMCESLHLLQSSTDNSKTKTQESNKEKSDSELLSELLEFKVDSPVECDYEGKGEYWPCVVRRVNDNATYDLEYVNDYKWIGTQRQVDPELVQKRGENEKRSRGEGVWHWDGMSDDEDDDFKYDSDDEDGEDGEDEDKLKKNKDRLSFQQFNALSEVVLASNRNIEVCVDSLNRLAIHGSLPFRSVKELAAAVAADIATMAPSYGSSVHPVDCEDYILLNLLYAPRRSKLFSVMKTLSRIENVGYICAWTKKSHLEIEPKIIKSSQQGSIPFACPPIDFVELSRLKLAFTTRVDHEGVVRLYSVDHVDLFVCNDRNPMTSQMLAGIPHSLLLSNVRGETKVLVPVVPPFRPKIANAPFSTFIVLNRMDMPLSERFFLYPVHVSLSFLLTKGINSAVYLMLLRFLHRDYSTVFRLADSIATDTSFNDEGAKIFKSFCRTNDDWHPDAHACRLKISLVTIDSGAESPWDLTIECARHIVKLDSISSSCRLAPEEELQLLESDKVVLSSDNPRYNITLHDDYSMALCYNRKHHLRTLLGIIPSDDSFKDIHVDTALDEMPVPCRVPPRKLLTNWPYYQDNTVFGENYAQMIEITSATEGDHSWANEVVGGDTEDAPQNGWLVVACFHTLWSAKCVQVMPSITELVPLYQDLASFLTVRADCQGIVSISKKLNITTFPTIVFFRGGKEVDRIVGHERLVEKVVRCLSSHVTEEDKICHAKRRHRHRLEAALAAGVDPSTLEEEDGNKNGELEWTWDPEQCGESMCIEDNGMRVVMRDMDDVDGDLQWEISQDNSTNWKPISSKTQQDIEKAYKKGKLYLDGYFSNKELDMWPSNVKISTYEVSGFYGSWNDGSFSGYIRRRGDRLQVPGEESYITKEQQERDERSAEWRKRLEAFKKKMREEKYGSDIESMRGTIGILPNTGKHKWTMRWNHEPARRGVSDAFGIAGDAYEQFGPMKGPCLGGSEDTGSSLALHADGKLYHNGSILCCVEGIRHLPEKEEKSETQQTVRSDVEQVKEMEKKVKSNKKSKKSKGKKTKQSPEDQVEDNRSGQGEFPREDWAPLFGRKSLVACEFDSDLDGGTLRFFIEEKPLEVAVELKEMYKLLGTSEIFPCISMCPYDREEDVEELPPNPSSNAQESNETADESSDDESGDESDGSEDEASVDKSQELTPEEQEAIIRQKEEEELHKEPSVTLLPPGWEEIQRQEEEAKEKARLEAAAKEEKRKKDELENAQVEQDGEVAKQETDVDSDKELASAEKVECNDSSLEKTEAPDIENGCPESKDDCNEEAESENVVEIPVERIRWMWESDDGWVLYNTFLSKELEEASRDGKTQYNLTFHREDDKFMQEDSITHKCSIDAKTMIDDSGTCRRLRRHVISEGVASMWELLIMKYEKPHGLTGQGFLKTLEKVWGGSETLDGKANGLGFLFLYSLLSGDSKARVVGSSGSGWGGMGGGGMSGGYMMYGGHGGYSAYGKSRSNTSDSHRFALLLTQLYTDRHTKSLPASVVNVLGRNRQVSLRMPRFKDTRKNTGVAQFKGWVDETEPRSPVAELFSKVVPLMRTMKRKSAFHFPPPPPHKEMTERPKYNKLKKPIEDKKGKGYEMHGFNRPELSDYGCEKRCVRSITKSEVAELANAVHYRLGKDSLRPMPPLLVKNTEHFRQIIDGTPQRLFVVDFFASWCGPCKAMAPVFRKLALRTPTAVFLKVDIDECDKLAAEFEIEKLPTVKFLRGGSKLKHQVAEIRGGGPQFLFEFAQILNAKATKEETALLQKYTFNAPGDNVNVVLENMSSSNEEINELVSQPLQTVSGFVTQSTRANLGMPEVNSEMAFDVSNHEASRTAVAASVLNRIRDDVVAYATFANSTKLSKIMKLADNDINGYFQGKAESENSLREAHEAVEELLENLYDLRDSDAQMVEDTIPLLEKASNWVNIYDNNSSDHESKTLFLLNRMAGRNTNVWVEFLFGTLISSSGESDLRRLNPFLSPDTIETMLNLVTVCMLRSNRLGHTNRCIGMTISLHSLLTKVLDIRKEDRAIKGETLSPKLIQSSEELSKNITVCRHYMTKTDLGWTFDPRYLVFEFVWNIQLRQKQVEIVDNFRHNLKNGTSKVKQMIMGAGKTSVVAPLLALILADGKSLVLSVVPKALVELSRTNMRETFAAIMVKRIYTLDFDRSTTVQPAMRRSLENAATNRGVVVATPTTIKSIMLSYVEILLQVKESHRNGLKSKLDGLKTQAEELSKIIKLFNDGVMLLDEVDLILHPLKSELNFPIGDKFDLDGSEEGERWSLPIHLLDAVFYTSTGKVSTFEQRGMALDILKRFADVVQEGIARRDLQRLPHITLLNNDFYHECMKPILAEWAYLWLQKQHLHGIDRQEAVQYMLEGAAARSDNSTKVNLIEAELTRAHIRTGDLAPVPLPTLGHQRSMSKEEKSTMSANFKRLKHEAHESFLADEEEQALVTSQIEHLEEAKKVAEEHHALVNDVYDIDEQIETHANRASQAGGDLHNEILALTNKIAEIECPRDDSLDNSVIVWMSQAFANVGGGMGASSNTAPSETSVSSICNILEDSGYTIRRCSDSEEAMSRARDLQLQGQLRCVIVGGDEHGTGCGPSCVKNHAGEICLRCQHSGFAHFAGHSCPNGGRGSFPLVTRGVEDMGPLKLMKSLTDEESPYARLHCALPALRTAVYSAHTTVKETDRMEFWKIGTTVTDEAKQLVHWAEHLPSWGVTEDPMDLDTVSEDEDDEEIPEEVPSMVRQSSEEGDKLLLQKYRAQLEKLEDKKLSTGEHDESIRKDLIQRVADKNSALNVSVKRRIDYLTEKTKIFEEKMRKFDSIKKEKAKGSIGPHCGRDCALALAWLDVCSGFRDQSSESFVTSLYKHYHNVQNELCFMKQMSLAAKVIAMVTSAMHKKLLNLCHNWLSTFLPHCLAKVNRVSFGLLSPADCKAALEADPHVPRSRLKLAVPFVGKDVPSRSSEFAHPDIIIGLTVLAYRYSGIRRDDYVDIIDSLTTQFNHEIGPARDRESCIRHESWVYAAGGAIRGVKSTREGKPWASDGDIEKEVVQLKFLQKSNEEQMDKLYKLLTYEPLVIHHYLTKTVLPLHMRSQRMKISASGQAVGGDMLVGKRLGFSGTPSDLLPEELGKCDYETGDDGMMLSTVLDKSVASYEFVKDGWTVEDLLESFATSDSPRYNALIDTGALITGYSNKEVAQQLLDRGLEWCDGVVFLDDDDRQQVLVRATGRTVSADQCGVPLERRFAFYDQIHTTGMDIKHIVNATAVITLGKDMVFRDYVQGAYRMRGIGAGQKIHICIIPEVAELMRRELKDASAIPSFASAAVAVQGNENVLENIVAWLTVNSLRSEQVQWTMLCLQNIGNLYRKNAFKALHKEKSISYFVDGSVSEQKDETLEASEPEKFVNNSGIDDFLSKLDKDQALALFNESIDFSLEAGVPDPVPFEKKLRGMLDEHEHFLLPKQHSIGHNIMNIVGQFAMLEGSANRLDTEQEREQEQEQEKEVEARRDKQIEVEKFVDREYSRQEETQRPWPFRILSQNIPPYDPNDSCSEHPFYPLKDFKLRHQEPLDFPDGMYVSTNYFNPKWSGLRRVKNVVIVMEFAPSTNPDQFHLRPLVEERVELTEDQEKSFSKAYSLLGFDALTRDKPDFISRRNDLRNAIFSATDILLEEDRLDKIMNEFSSDPDFMSYEEFRKLLTCGVLQPEFEGRYWVALSLSEAETIRRILHIRQRLKATNNASSDTKSCSMSLVMQSGSVLTGSPQKLIDHHSTQVALHYSPACAPSAPSAGDGGLVLDSSREWLHDGSQATPYEASKVHCCFRFFDGDMHFPTSALNLLVRNITGSVYDRERFFHAVVGCRRRMERKWQDTPLARVFTVPHQWLSLKQAAQASFVREALKAKQLTLWEGFTAFDYDNTGMLNPAEVYGALLWLRVPKLTAMDVVDFIEAADRNKDGIVDYREYMDMLEDPTVEHVEGEEGMDGDDRTESVSIAKVEPFGADVLREEMIKRKQAEIQKQKDERLRRQAYKDALDVKVFEEELEASKLRKGGANPVVYNVVCKDNCQYYDKSDVTVADGDNSDDCDNVTVTDFKFSCNELPLRLAPTGKFSFIPLFLGTRAQKPIQPMTCPKKHKLVPYNYFWMHCMNCKKRSTQYSCEVYCGYYVCSNCYQGDRRAQEMVHRDPSKNPTFLRLSKNCCFTLQLPAEGFQALKPHGSCEFTLSMEVRFQKLPPKGHLQSLIRFSLPDLAQARRMHRAGLYLNGDGVVVSKAIPKGGLISNDSDPENPVGGRCMRSGCWHLISVTVKPNLGEVTTYVNGQVCHECTKLDPADLRMQYKLVVLGGGRQAQNRGGDIRRLTIHSKHFNSDEMQNLYYHLSQDNPAVGGRAVRIQAAFRGYIKRKALEAEGIATKFFREEASKFIDADPYACDY